MRFIAFLLAAVASLTAAAQDVPGRVGRVSFIEGSVAIYQDPDIGWEKAYVNSPVTSENSLWTDPGARAEVRVSAVALRLDSATQLDVSRLDDDVLTASIARGAVAVRIRHNEYNSRFMFDTPEARFTLSREGRYRIDVDPDRQETRLAVLAGEASMETAQGARRIQNGQLVRISNGDFRFERAAPDALDRWAEVRDRTWVESKAPQYVSTYMTGYEDLDRHGQWIQEPGYGPLWMPTQVAADWVPYRYGHWAYIRPWGWTWIDDQPWGYAPFHYGRWVYARDRWCWYPGQRTERPAWAPALVAWVGGSNWSVSTSSGPVMGWYPLAPNESYRPWYHANDRYVSRVNSIVIRGNDRNRNDSHRDWNRERAVTAVPRENLIERRPVQGSMIRVNADAARNAPAVQPQNVAPNNNEIQRMRAARARTAPASVAQQPAAAPQGNAPIARDRGQRDRNGQQPAQPQQPQSLPLTAPQIAPGAPIAPSARPSFARPQPAAPSPAAPALEQRTGALPHQGPQGRQAQPAPAAQAPAAQAPATQAPAAQAPAQGNPLSRGSSRSDSPRERNADRPPQERAQPQAQSPQAQPDARAAEAQRARQQQEAQQRQQQEAQQRQQQEARQRQQQEAQQRQRQQQEAQQRQQHEAQQRQQQEAQRQQQEAQRQQQAELQRRAAEAQRAAQQQQQQQQQRQQQPQQPKERPQPPAQAQPQAQPAPQGNPAARGEEHRARPKDDDDKDKEKGKGR